MSKLTITCKKCGHELPAGSTFCDKCGAQVTKTGKVKPAGREKAKGKKSNIGFIVVAGIVIFVIALMVSLMTTSKNDVTSDLEEDPYESFDDRLAKMTSRVTPEMYEQIEFAMDYDDVVALLGEEGAQNYGNHYAWPGEYFDMAEYTYEAPRVEVEFGHTMKVIGISEHNVIHGKEIYETKTSEDLDPDLHISDEQLKSMKGRMSYREIADIIGEEGRLKEANSEKNGNESKTYEWRYIKGGESGYPTTLNITFYDDKAMRSKYDEWGE